MKKFIRRVTYMGLTGLGCLMNFESESRPSKSLEKATVEEKSYAVKGLTGILSIPKVNDIYAIEENLQKIEENSYNYLMEEQKNEKIKLLTEEDRSHFGDHFRQNLCSIAVHIIEKGKNGKNKSAIDSWGSGVYITEEGFLLTANHLLQKDGRYNLVALSFTKKMEPVLNNLKVLAFSPERDIALCKIEENSKIKDLSPIKLRKDKICLDDEVAGLLFEYRLKDYKSSIETYNVNKSKILINSQNLHPFTMEEKDDGIYYTASFQKCNPVLILWDGAIGFVDKLNHNRNESIRYTDVVIREMETKNLNKFSYLTPFVGKCESGNSGSAIFDGMGNLIGIMSIGNQEANQGYMVPSSTIRDFLTQYQNFKQGNE